MFVLIKRGDIVKLEHKISKSSQIKITSVWCQFTANYLMSLEAWRGTLYENALMKMVFFLVLKHVNEKEQINTVGRISLNKCCQPQKQQFTTD